MEVRVDVECWRKEYNRYRPHCSLGYKPPALEAFEAKNLTLRVVH
ncbi:MAG: transposase [Candidatus Aminicenantes bacterium]|nr:transposase [Candidatus Aminicenantes bacterium]